jgi:hypothetical protein
MSDQFELSHQMVEDIKSVLASHDERAKDDLITTQYLAALMGFILGNQQMSVAKRRELLEDLGGFSAHVMQQIEQQQLQQVAPPTQDAFGIWHPGDS